MPCTTKNECAIDCAIALWGLEDVFNALLRKIRCSASKLAHPIAGFSAAASPFKEASLVALTKQKPLNFGLSTYVLLERWERFEMI
jgi:hypothetical protein